VGELAAWDALPYRSTRFPSIGSSGENDVTDPLALTDRIREESAFLGDVRQDLGRVLVGQSEMVDGLLIGLLADGHVLLEGLPGLAKTLAGIELAGAIGGEFRRLQFTPDLLPADLSARRSTTRSGDWDVGGAALRQLRPRRRDQPRDPPTQSALLEAMQEKQVSVAGETRDQAADEPYCVLATQNPVEQEGTYPLPEAQVDRFLLKIVVGYPERRGDRDHRAHGDWARRRREVRQVSSPEQILRAREMLGDAIFLDDMVLRYIVDIVFATREPGSVGLEELSGLILYGASPRASIALTRCAGARVPRGRAFVTPQDVKAVAPPVLRHRVLETYEAEAEGLSARTS
jgi:MoxR-like ATPase